MTTTLSISFDQVQELFESSEEFPVDFDIAWQWLGHSTKGNAKKILVKNFEEEIDYIIIQIDTSSGYGITASREDIFLTANCLKEMGMLAKTPKGKEVRKYFIQCEQIAIEFTKKHKELVIGEKLTKELTDKFDELKRLSVVMADNFLQSISPIPVVKTHVTTENDLNSSLVANRLGLAFNKHLKTFETLSDAMSPEAFSSLKRQYSELVAEHAELLKLKNPIPKIEVLEKIVEVERVVRDELEITNLLIDKANLESRAEYLQSENKRLTKELKECLLHSIPSPVNSLSSSPSTSKKHSIKQIQQIDDKFLLPGS